MNPSPATQKRTPRLALPPLILWGIRELMRRPAANGLMAAALCALTLLVAGVLLLNETLSRSATVWVDRGPELVVRRIGRHGYRPLPGAEAVRRATSLPGITAARLRIWGTAATDSGPVTVMGDDAWLQAHLWREPAARTPGPGEAFSGWRHSAADAPNALIVRGVDSLTVRIAGRVMPGAPSAFSDLLLLAPQDARRVLGLADGEVTDLALDVFHSAEADALKADLAAALPWPVEIRTKNEVRRWYAAGFARRGGLVLLMYVPALLALGLIVLNAAAWQSGTRRHIGLLKALGWTTTDLVRLQLVKALVLGLPAVALGGAAAGTLVLSPWSTWLGVVLLGWNDAVPGEIVDPAAALLIGLEVIGFVFLPFLAAGLWPAVTSAAASPDDLLREEM